MVRPTADYRGDRIKVFGLVLMIEVPLFICRYHYALASYYLVLRPSSVKGQVLYPRLAYSGLARKQINWVMPAIDAVK